VAFGTPVLMKYIFLFFVCWNSLADSSSVNMKIDDAKPSRWPKMTIVPTLGFSVFSSTGKGASENRSTTEGLVAGGLIDFNFNSPWKLESGLLFTQEGDALRGSSYTRTNNYVLLPVLARVTFATSHPATFHFRGGLAPSLLISSQQQSDLRASPPQEEAFDIQGMLGVGSALALTSQTSLDLNFTFVRGLVSFLRNSSEGIYNQGFMLTGGMTF
jgi:hypothetical protein